MEFSKRVLSSLLVALFVLALVPGSIFGDGPWDIDQGGGSETRGGSTIVHDRNATSSSAGTLQGGSETGGDGPSLVASLTYSWLYQMGLSDLADKVLFRDIIREQVESRTVESKTRR